MDNETWSKPTPIQQQQQGRIIPFGPGQPILPSNPEERPRIFEYRPGVNLVSVPRSGYGLVDFKSLRNLASACKEIRLNIELIKRQVRSLEWAIVPARDKDPRAAVYGPDIASCTEQIETPDGYHDFDSWVNILMEDLLAIDAVTIFPAGETGPEIVDGATIFPLLDLQGRPPTPPTPAYIQMLHGMPTSYFDREHLIYRPLNTSVTSPYGSTPIEWIILAVNLALRRDTFHVASFTEGNIPDALIGAPSNWGQVQIDTWQHYWDALVQGNLSNQRKMHWIPLDSASSGVPIYEFRKDDQTNTERDKWLMQVACWAFGNSPSEFGLVPGDGLGGAGYAQGMEAVQYRSMFGPITQYLARLLTLILRRLGYPHLKFKWLGLEPQRDALQQAQVDQLYLQSGVYNAAYIQERLAIPEEYRPKEMPGGNPYGLAPTVQPVNLPSMIPAVQPVQLPAGFSLSAEAQADLRLWKRKALHAGSYVAFASSHIPPDLARQVDADLQIAKKDDICKLFDAALGAASARFFPNNPQSWDTYG